MPCDEYVSSALLESKTLEERDKQILFKKEVKQTEDIEKQNLSVASSLQNASLMESNELKNKLLRKRRDLDVARTNQVLTNDQREKMLQEKEQKSEGIKDELLERNLLEREIKIKMNELNYKKELIIEFEADRKRIRKLQEKKDEQDERLRKLYNKYHENIKNKVQIINNQTHKNKAITLQAQHVYNIIENKNNEKSKQYVAFIEKGVNNLKNKEKHLERAEIEKKFFEENKNKQFNEENKKLSELQNRLKSEENTKLVCHKQSFLGNSRNKSLNMNNNTLNSNLSPKRNLKEDLKKREKEPSPWSGLSSTHLQFAEQASEILNQCRHKHMARKVIDDYRKINCLDAKSLPIHNH